MQGNDKCLEKREWMKKVARNVCQSRRVKQTLSDVVEDRKLVSRERLFTLLGYDLTVRWTKAEKGTKLGEEPRSQSHETRVKLECDNRERCVVRLENELDPRRCVLCVEREWSFKKV